MYVALGAAASPNANIYDTEKEKKLDEFISGFHLTTTLFLQQELSPSSVIAVETRERARARPKSAAAAARAVNERSRKKTTTLKTFWFSRRSDSARATHAKGFPEIISMDFFVNRRQPAVVMW